EGNIANAENFMLLPIIAAAILIFDTSSKKSNHKLASLRSVPSAINYKLATAGLLLGIAFLYKIVALFDFAAFFVFVLFLDSPERLSLSSLKKTWLPMNAEKTFWLVTGFLTPLLITLIYFSAHNALQDFIQATFFGNVGYVNYGNKFIIPQGL